MIEAVASEDQPDSKQKVKKLSGFKFFCVADSNSGYKCVGIQSCHAEAASSSSGSAGQCSAQKYPPGLLKVQQGDPAIAAAEAVLQPASSFASEVVHNSVAQYLATKGIPNLKDCQRTVVNALLRPDCRTEHVCVFPTGMGKSLLFHVPGIALHGMTLVFSPLKALHYDQVSSLKACGVRAERLDSSLSSSERQAVMDKVGKIFYLTF